MLCAEMYGAPYDLLAAALNVRPDRLRGIVARWRHAGYADTGTLARPGLVLAHQRRDDRHRPAFPAARPALGRLAHIRAVLAARLVWNPARPGKTGGPGGAANAVSAPPSAAGSGPVTSPTPKCMAQSWQPPNGGRVGHRSRTDPQAPRPDRDHHARAAVPPHRLQPRRDRTRPRYGQVVYLTGPAARPVVTRAAAALPAPLQPRVVVRDLPEEAMLCEVLVVAEAFTVRSGPCRQPGRVFRWPLMAAVLVAASPLTAVAALGYLAAWLRGWPPRLWHAAAWALPMTAVYARGGVRLHLAGPGPRPGA